MHPDDADDPAVEPAPHPDIDALIARRDAAYFQLDACGRHSTRSRFSIAHCSTGWTSDSLLAVSRSRQALATQIPNRLAERLRVGNLPSG